MACMVMVGFLLVSAINITDIGFEREVVLTRPALSWHVYRDYRHGFSLRLPPGWAIEAQNETILFEGPRLDQEMNVSVYEAAEEKAVKKGLAISKEEKTAIDGRAAVKATTDFETVYLVKNGGRLFVLRSNNGLTQIFSSFRFLF